MFPRVRVDPHTEKQIVSYNRVALQMGRKAQQLNIKTIFVRQLWINITCAQAAGCYLRMSDWLHLRACGKEIVAGMWIDALYDRLVTRGPQVKKDKRKGAPGGASCSRESYYKQKQL